MAIESHTYLNNLDNTMIQDLHTVTRAVQLQDYDHDAGVACCGCVKEALREAILNVIKQILAPNITSVIFCQKLRCIWDDHMSACNVCDSLC